MFVVAGISVVGCPLYMAGLRFHPKGTKVRGNIGPIALRRTSLPFASSHMVKSVPGYRPMLTPSSVTGTFFVGMPVA